VLHNAQTPCLTCTQAAKNGRNCELLFLLVKRAGAHVARLTAMSAEGKPMSPALKQGMRRLGQQLVRAARLIRLHAGNHFVKRFVCSDIDKAAFKLADMGLRNAMEVSAHVACLGLDFNVICVKADHTNRVCTPARFKALLRNTLFFTLLALCGPLSTGSEHGGGASGAGICG
jgi:hypothetical protein